ncbi:MAG: hypothetical protein O7C59_10325, partial [Rickettsia endosymbiont of Ixodes persulcatus]|nr:hypothetical protein [Rickettsia endosymbiont of Ixodes persulcatus]
MTIVNAYTTTSQTAIASGNNALQNCVFPHYRLDNFISVNNQSAIYPILVQQEKIITQKLNIVIDDTISILKNKPNWKKLKQSIKEIETAQREAISNLTPIKYVEVNKALNRLRRWTSKLTPAQRSAAIDTLNAFKTEVSTSGYFVQRFAEGQNDTEQCNKHKQVLLYLTSLEDIIQVVRNSVLNTPKLSTESTSAFQTTSSIPSKSAQHLQATNT